MTYDDLIKRLEERGQNYLVNRLRVLKGEIGEEGFQNPLNDAAANDLIPALKKANNIDEAKAAFKLLMTEDGRKNFDLIPQQWENLKKSLLVVEVVLALKGDAHLPVREDDDLNFLLEVLNKEENITSIKERLAEEDYKALLKSLIDNVARLATEDPALTDNFKTALKDTNFTNQAGEEKKLFNDGININLIGLDLTNLKKHIAKISYLHYLDKNKAELQEKPILNYVLRRLSEELQKDLLKSTAAAGVTGLFANNNQLYFSDIKIGELINCDTDELRDRLGNKIKQPPIALDPDGLDDNSANQIIGEARLKYHFGHDFPKVFMNLLDNDQHAFVVYQNICQRIGEVRSPYEWQQVLELSLREFINGLDERNRKVITGVLPLYEEFGPEFVGALINKAADQPYAKLKLAAARVEGWLPKEWNNKLNVIRNKLVATKNTADFKKALEGDPTSALFNVNQAPALEVNPTDRLTMILRMEKKLGKEIVDALRKTELLDKVIAKIRVPNWEGDLEGLKKFLQEIAESTIPTTADADAIDAANIEAVQNIKQIADAISDDQASKLLGQLRLIELNRALQETSTALSQFGDRLNITVGMQLATALQARPLPANLATKLAELQEAFTATEAINVADRKAAVADFLEKIAVNPDALKEQILPDSIDGNAAAVDLQANALVDQVIDNIKTTVGQEAAKLINFKRGVLVELCRNAIDANDANTLKKFDRNSVLFAVKELQSELNNAAALAAGNIAINNFFKKFNLNIEADVIPDDNKFNQIKQAAKQAAIISNIDDPALVYWLQRSVSTVQLNNAHVYALNKMLRGLAESVAKSEFNPANVEESKKHIAAEIANLKNIGKLPANFPHNLFDGVDPNTFPYSYELWLQNFNHTASLRRIEEPLLRRLALNYKPLLALDPVEVNALNTAVAVAPHFDDNAYGQAVYQGREAKLQRFVEVNAVHIRACREDSNSRILLIKDYVAPKYPELAKVLINNPLAFRGKGPTNAGDVDDVQIFLDALYDVVRNPARTLKDYENLLLAGQCLQPGMAFPNPPFISKEECPELFGEQGFNLCKLGLGVDGLGLAGFQSVAATINNNLAAMQTEADKSNNLRIDAAKHVQSIKETNFFQGNPEESLKQAQKALKNLKIFSDGMHINKDQLDRYEERCLNLIERLKPVNEIVDLTDPGKKPVAELRQTVDNALTKIKTIRDVHKASIDICDNTIKDIDTQCKKKTIYAKGFTVEKLKPTATESIQSQLAAKVSADITTIAGATNDLIDFGRTLGASPHEKTTLRKVINTSAVSLIRDSDTKVIINRHETKAKADPDPNASKNYEDEYKIFTDTIVKNFTSKDIASTVSGWAKFKNKLGVSAHAEELAIYFEKNKLTHYQQCLEAKEIAAGCMLLSQQSSIRLTGQFASNFQAAWIIVEANIIALERGANGLPVTEMTGAEGYNFDSKDLYSIAEKIYEARKARNEIIDDVKMEKTARDMPRLPRAHI